MHPLNLPIDVHVNHGDFFKGEWGGDASPQENKQMHNFSLLSSANAP
jgi:hypothetical protein